MIREGATGIVALGTTGEPAVLTDDEQRQVLDTCAEACRATGRGLMVGAGSNSTRTTIEAVCALEAVRGVTAALVVVPYYTRPSGAAIVEHYRAVAAASPVPIVAYNIPYRTGRGLTASEILEIAAIPNMIGLKQSVGGIDTDTLEVLRSAPPHFHVFAGDDAFIVPTILIGGAGAISAAAHVCTSLFAEMVDAGLQGDMGRARALAERLLPVVEAGFAEPSPAGWKAALHQLGEIATPNLRAPMSCASDAPTARLMDAIEVALSIGVGE